MPNIQHLEDLIAEGKTEEALDALLEAFRDTEHRHEIILLKSQYAEIHSHHRIGIVTYDEFQLGRNKINHALLRFIQSIQKEVPEKISIPEIESPFSDADPLSFHKKMLPVIALKLRKSRSFYQQCMLAVIIMSLAIFVAGVYFQNTFFHFGGGALSSISLIPVWLKFKISQQLLFVEGLSHTLIGSPPSGKEAELIGSTLMTLVQKNLSL
ncbi:MAG: hypothetical protein H7246_04875 [Phycisphaerae bacterium]|nr:hypothetical protein [Saprospiraceae bacterium]